MTTTNQGVIDAFTNGEEAKNHSGSLHSEDRGDGMTLLVGYNWAVYAINWHGQFYKFPEWHGYSTTTSRHWNMMEASAGQKAGVQGVCTCMEGRPESSDNFSSWEEPIEDYNQFADKLKETA